MSKVYLFMKFDVADFAKWKAVYDDHIPIRQQFGLKDLYVLRNIENQNSVTLFFEVEDLEKVKLFLASDELRNKEKESGVMGKSTFEFLK
ncbi:MAG: hypothetical protein K2W92_07140 [Alphaproteobacteria bacterium]|nr:hypothetical protein [Alphaproteobacteria bacterium]